MNYCSSIYIIRPAPVPARGSGSRIRCNQELKLPVPGGGGATTRPRTPQHTFSITTRYRATRATSSSPTAPRPPSQQPHDIALKARFAAYQYPQHIQQHVKIFQARRKRLLPTTPTSSLTVKNATYIQMHAACPKEQNEVAKKNHRSNDGTRLVFVIL